MNRKGFVTSALLYGILSLFLVLILGTVSVISGRKLALDKLKQTTLDEVQNLSTRSQCFVVEAIDSNYCMITGYYGDNEQCSNVVFIPQTIKIDDNEYIVSMIGPNAFKKSDGTGAVNDGTVTIMSNIGIIDEAAFSGNSNVLFIFKSISENLKNDDNFSKSSGTIWGAERSYLTLE